MGRSCLASVSLLACAVAACGQRSVAPSRRDAALAAALLELAPTTSAADVRSQTHALAHRLQGSWLVRNSKYPGSVQAWGVDGDAVTVYDTARGRSDVERFAVNSPCHLTLTLSIGGDPNLDGNPREVVTSTDTFVFARDGLHVAMAAAAGGFRRGSHVVACIGDRLYAYDTRSARCEAWLDLANTPSLEREQQCAIDTSTAAAAFIVSTSGTDEPLSIPLYDDALMSAPLVGSVAEPQASFHEAVQRADAILKAATRAEGTSRSRPMAPSR